MKIKFEKIRKIITALPVMMARRAFLTFLFLLFLAVGMGAVLFYRSGYFTQKSDLGGGEYKTGINDKVYQDVLNQWQKDNQRFNDADSKIYKNIFGEELTKNKN
jgi:hypothetical protein